MNEGLIDRIVPELCDELVGLAFREILQLHENQFAIAFEGDEFKLLFVGIDAREPRIYLIKRRLRELKREKQNPSKFAVDAEKALAGMRLTKVLKYESERIVEFRFESAELKSLIAQLTGKSANVFLLDADRRILAAAHKPGDSEQSLGMIYSAPAPPPSRGSEGEALEFHPSENQTLSELLDEYFLRRDEREKFTALAAKARRKNQTAEAKLKRLIRNLEADIAHHGDPEKWKKYGDLLLASQATARREGDSVVVTDLFDEAAPLIAIETDENDTIAEAAQKYFRKYAKARSAVAEVASRIETVKLELARASKEGDQIEKAIAAGDEEFLLAYADENKKTEKETRSKKGRAPRLPPGIRSFWSSDGFEILVGKKATDNDLLTFRVAQSRDTWMHAADYPGSHVVVRNPDRKEIPQRTLIEAAQLAAFYSQGRKQVKAAVSYTEKKFVSKPKGVAPGLVRLASFKTLLVEPSFPEVSQG